MGACCTTATEEEREEARIAKQIDRQQNQDMKAEQKKVKMLLLGTGESGKSTVFKQMKVLYGAPLTIEEQRHYTQVVYSNVISAIKVLCIMSEQMEPDGCAEIKGDMDRLRKLGDFECITAPIAEMIKRVWEDAAVQRTWNRRSEYQIVDSHKAYLDEILRIGGAEYMATQQDILLSRVRTSGIVVDRYEIENIDFEMYDVGGQRNDAKEGDPLRRECDCCHLCGRAERVRPGALREQLDEPHD